MESDDETGLRRCLPQRLPHVIPERNVDARGQEHARAQPEGAQLVDLLGRRLGVVDRNETGAHESLRRRRAELREPLVVGAIADAAQLRILDEEGHDGTVHDGGVHAVAIHVGQPQGGGGGPQHAGLEDAATLEGHAPATHGPGGAATTAPGIPAIRAAHPVRAVVGVDDARGLRAPRRGDAGLPQVLRQPLQIDVIVGGDDAVVHARLLMLR
jgi:hypothetical protein